MYDQGELPESYFEDQHSFLADMDFQDQLDRDKQ